MTEIESQAATAAALPSLTELGLLQQQQQQEQQQQHMPSKAWWMPSLERGRASQGNGSSCSSSNINCTSRSGSPARKRPARSRERELRRLSFASGPLPFPALMRRRPTREDGQKEKPKEKPAASSLAPAVDAHTPADTHDASSSSDSDDSDDADVPSTLIRQPPLLHGLSAPADGDRRSRWSRMGRRDEKEPEGDKTDQDKRPRLFPLRWPLKRPLSKRKREASPKPEASAMGTYESHFGRGSLGDSSSSSSDDERPPVRLTLRRRAARPGRTMTADIFRHVMSEGRRQGDMYVLYKFDRVDELGGRRRGERQAR